MQGKYILLGYMAKLNLSLCFLLTEHHSIKAYWGMEVQLHSFFDLGTRCRWVVNFTPLPLYPQGKSLLYPLDRRLGGPQNRSERGGEGQNSQPLPGLEPLILKWLCVCWLPSLQASSDSIGSRLRAGRPGLDFRQEQWWFFSLRHRIQTGSVAYPASYPTGTGDSYPGSEAPGSWSWSLTSI
jgi:hypothetical protein